MSVNPKRQLSRQAGIVAVTKRQLSRQAGIVAVTKRQLSRQAGIVAVTKRQLSRQAGIVAVTKRQLSRQAGIVAVTKRQLWVTSRHGTAPGDSWPYGAASPATAAPARLWHNVKPRREPVGAPWPNYEYVRQTVREVMPHWYRQRIRNIT